MNRFFWSHHSTGSGIASSAAGIAAGSRTGDGTEAGLPVPDRTACQIMVSRLMCFWLTVKTACPSLDRLPREIMAPDGPDHSRDQWRLRSNFFLWFSFQKGIDSSSEAGA